MSTPNHEWLVYLLEIEATCSLVRSQSCPAQMEMYDSRVISIASAMKASPVPHTHTHNDHDRHIIMHEDVIHD